MKVLKDFFEKSIRSSLFDFEKSTRPCSFIEHAVCVSTIMDQFRIPKSKCLPACISHTFSPRVSQNFIMISVLVRNPCQAKIHSVCQNKSEKSSTHATGSEPDKWHRHNITCHQTCRATKLKHQRNCLVFEGKNHKKSIFNLPFCQIEFLADVGGAAGLILGLNVLQALTFVIGVIIRLMRFCSMAHSQLSEAGQ